MPSCVTEKGWPAIVSVPARDCTPVLAATLYDTRPLPLPLAPDEMLSHPALLEAAHAHPVVVLTSTSPLPPPLGADAPVGVMA